MKFAFTDEQELLRRAVATFAAKELPPARLRELDAQGLAPGPELLPAMAALGFTALALPPDHGGLGGGAIDMAVMFEELGRHSLAASAMLAGAIGFGCEVLKRQGNAAQKHDPYEKLMRGAWSCGYVTAGPGCDPDAGVASARALPGDNGYLIDGTQLQVSGTRDAPCLIVAAYDQSDMQALQLFAIDANAAGITWPAPQAGASRGLAAVHAVDFNAVRLAPDALLGTRDTAAATLQAALAHARRIEAASCVGCAQQAIDGAVRYAGERQQFGQPIGKFQAISHLLVDLQVEVDAARTLLYRAAWTADRGGDAATDSALAHLATSEALLNTTSQAMRVYGGYGLTMEFDIGRHFRDARWLVVGDGAARSQRDLVARSMGLTA